MRWRKLRHTYREAGQRDGKNSRHSADPDFHHDPPGAGQPGRRENAAQSHRRKRVDHEISGPQRGPRCVPEGYRRAFLCYPVHRVQGGQTYGRKRADPAASGAGRRAAEKAGTYRAGAGGAPDGRREHGSHGGPACQGIFRRRAGAAV